MNIDEAVEQLESIRDWIRWSVCRFTEAELFFGHGTDNALDEAVALVMNVLHLPIELSSDYFASRLTTTERRSVAELVQKRIESRKPLAYLTNEAWFAGLPFYVDERVLVPRSPVAELIQQHFSPWIQASDPLDILDLCTGSGCIAIACALEFPQAQVVASDVSADALAVAAINVERYHLQQQVSLVESDVFEQIAPEKFDLIVSNPPYVSHASVDALPEEYRREPELGLRAGVDGLEIVRRILSQAAEYLKPGGVLIVEVGESEQALVECYKQLPFIWLEFEHGGEGVFVLSADQLPQSSEH